MAESLSALARGSTDIGEAAAFMAEAFMVVVVFAAGDLDEEALTVEDLDAEASAVMAGSMVEVDSVAAQAEGFTVEVGSAAVQAAGFMVEADSTAEVGSMAVAGGTAADTAKLSSADNQPKILTAGGICLRPFFFSIS
jgi:hypothetical protein